MGRSIQVNGHTVFVPPILNRDYDTRTELPAYVKTYSAYASEANFSMFTEEQFMMAYKLLRRVKKLLTETPASYTNLKDASAARGYAVFPQSPEAVKFSVRGYITHHYYAMELGANGKMESYKYPKLFIGGHCAREIYARYARMVYLAPHPTVDLEQDIFGTFDKATEALDGMILMAQKGNPYKNPLPPQPHRHPIYVQRTGQRTEQEVHASLYKTPPIVNNKNNKSPSKVAISTKAEPRARERVRAIEPRQRTRSR